MKMIVLLLLTFCSLSAFAFPETVCEGRLEGKRISVEIERGFPNSNFRYIDLYVTEGSQGIKESVTASVYAPPRFNRVQFSARNFRMEIDFWPDQRPQWGRTYRGSLQSGVLANRNVSLFCRYQ